MAYQEEGKEGMGCKRGLVLKVCSLKKNRGGENLKNSGGGEGIQFSPFGTSIL